MGPINVLVNALSTLTLRLVPILEAKNCGAFWIPLPTQAEETASKQDSEGLTEDFLSNTYEGRSKLLILLQQKMDVIGFELDLIVLQCFEFVAYL